jgi:ABC-type sugar transport system substrate-binding protein
MAKHGTWCLSRNSWSLMLFCAVLLNAGCDSGSFIPPPPDGLKDEDGEAITALPASSSAVSASLEAVPSGARSVELFMDRRLSDDAEAVRASARQQAGLDKVKLRTSVLTEQDLPARQAELVRESLSRQPLAIIVEPADPTDRRLHEALEKAQDDGVPIILLNRPLAAAQSPAKGQPDPKQGAGTPGQPGATGTARIETHTSPSDRPMILVSPPSFEASASKLVASAFRNAKNAKLDPSAGAIIVINPTSDPFVQTRIDALRAALVANGVSKIEEIPFAQNIEVGSRLVRERLKANPKLALVFSIDSMSSSASRNAMNELGTDRPFIPAGYSAEDSFAEITKVADFAAVALYAPARIVRKAIDTAIAVAEGRPVPSRVEVPIVVHDSNPDSALPQSPTYHRKMNAAPKNPKMIKGGGAD